MTNETGPMTGSVDAMGSMDMTQQPPNDTSSECDPIDIDFLMEHSAIDDNIHIRVYLVMM